jgi:hypothetical protein
VCFPAFALTATADDCVPPRQSNLGIYDRRRAGRAPLISFVLLPFVLLDCGIISYFYLSHLR